MITMWIYAKSINGEMFSLEVTKNDKINEVKKKIENIIGLSSHEQKLVYQARILEDDKTVHFYRISEKSTINVIDRFRGGMQIYIRTMDGKVNDLEIVKTETITEVKNKIRKKIGLYTNELILMYQGEILDEFETVEFYHFSEKTFMYVLVRDTFQINIKIITGDTIQIQVTKAERIIDIKRMIQDKTRIHIFDQILSHGDIILGNKMTLGDCLLSSNSTINVSLRDAAKKKRGICVIISNESFPKYSVSPRSNRGDETRISETFEPLGFKIMVHRDVALTAMERLIAVIKDEVQDSDTMFVVFLLCPTDNDVFLTSDYTKWSLDNLWAPFSNEKFHRLKGKPKLFFVVNTPLKCDVELGSTSGGSLVADTNRELNAETMTDLFVGFSVGRAYVPQRDVVGTVKYVDSLCDVITRKADWHIADIHQEVQRRLAVKSFTNDGLQGCHCINHLSDPAYFIKDGQ